MITKDEIIKANSELVEKFKDIIELDSDNDIRFNVNSCNILNTFESTVNSLYNKYITCDASKIEHFKHYTILFLHKSEKSAVIKNFIKDGSNAGRTTEIRGIRFRLECEQCTYDSYKAALQIILTDYNDLLNNFITIHE